MRTATPPRACAYSARAPGLTDAVTAQHIPLLREHHGHPSLRTLLADGFQNLPF